VIEPDEISVSTEHSTLFNRELSWIQFNERVLEEALNPAIPLLERLKFLAIFSSNLDEFFMVRISGIQEQLETSPALLSPDGLTPATQLKLISERLRPLIRKQTDCLLQQVLPGLAKLGVELIRPDTLTVSEANELQRLFYDRIFPVLTPLAVDPGHPFPYISNISLNLGVLLAPTTDGIEEKPRFARVKVPPNVPRLIPVGEGHRFMLLEELMSVHIGSLFPRCEVLECQPFRITRDADVEIEEDEAEDLLKSVEQTLRQRRFGFGVRLEVSSAMSPPMVDLLRRSLQLEDQDVYSIDGPLNIPDLMALYKLNLPVAKDRPFEPVNSPAFKAGENMFDVIRRQDVLVHHPYESFAPVIEFLRTAARDRHVLAIKQTLYRIGPDSPIVSTLIEAAERGKQVAVLVELKARFDEENNILWGRRLEQAGAHVIYGVVGLKTHAKLALIVRQEGNALRRYVHLSTGNYNPVTARVYTDMGLFTSNVDFGNDCSEFFNFLTGHSGQREYRKLSVAPVSLREKLTALIRREIAHRAAGRPAGIIIKCNSLTDTALIDELYTASAAGVPITLLVRGVCCLRPGLPGKSETVRVGSIVGRFLEHSRAYLFTNGGDEEVYLASADVMHRNLDRRIEIMFPVEDEHLRRRLRRELIEIALQDNTKLRWLRPDGGYYCPDRGDAPPRDSQAELLARYQSVS
jgi:polyphosphate kinase